ncbi:MAG TPA: hypothetical protein VK661_02520, partial [Planctomycetota bacterium]|nr:hypothetical protein [Planctomycetota bacterium]
LKRGNSWTQSFDYKHPERVQWFSAPGDPAKAMAAVAKWTPPDTDQNLRCNDLVRAVAPVVKEIVPEGRPVNANNITAGLRAAEEITRKAEPPPPVQRPPEPENKPIIEDKSREQKVVPKPGGVILAPEPSIRGLDPATISTAAFDPSTGILTFTLKDGGKVIFEADPDDFAVAVNAVFDRGVDPSLSMRWCDKPGYHAVDYCGPLFRTRFGKILYQTDKLLGAIIFNREGAHQATVADLIPGYAELAGEAHATMTTGSRVFLRAAAADFAVEEGRLVPGGVTCVIDVEGIGYGASYYQESLHRLARTLDRNFDALAETFEPFQEFRRLARLVAIAKWMKRRSVPFDAPALKERRIAEHEFPAYEPTSEWYTMFNGRNLDGWTCSLGSGGLESAASEGALTVRPTGTAALEIFAGTGWKNYDLRYNFATEGPVEIVIRSGAGDQGASVTVDTKGAPQQVECFLTDGAWTFLAPGAGSKGTLRIPEPAKDQGSEPNRYGLRVPPGSKITIYSVARRTR